MNSPDSLTLCFNIHDKSLIYHLVVSKKSFLIGTCMRKSSAPTPSICFNAHATLMCSIYSLTHKLFLARSWVSSPGPTEKSVAEFHRFPSLIFSPASREAKEFFSSLSQSSLEPDPNKLFLWWVLTCHHPSIGCHQGCKDGVSSWETSLLSKTALQSN